jgi:class 3 adenylate cyclase/predicted ATPase
VRYYGDAAVLVLALLQREGRLSYRSLARICGLDEAGLADLREDLLFRRLARDEDGKGLVWIGSAPPPDSAAVAFDSATPPATAAPPLAADSIPTEPAQNGPTLAPEPSRRTLDGERRQVTVMFCDLVASTELSQQFDAEDYRAVVRAYQAAAAAALQPYDGYIAQYLGDGLLVYFGWPQAHEDAAHRAVHASLALLDALDPLHDTHLLSHYGVRIAIRIGLHTGMAVIGEMGGGDRYEQLAMGDTPNLAARIQGLATPNTVALSAVTARLVQGAFALEDLGAHALKGVAEPMPIYRVLHPIEAYHEEEAPALGVPMLVGRDEEIGLLRRRWEQAREGLGQVVLVSGEAGIGKSALVRAVRHHIGREGVMRMTYRCSPYHTHSAFYPIIVHLEWLLQFERDDPPATRLTKLERLLTKYTFPLEEVVPLFAALLSVSLPEGAYPPLSLTPQQHRTLAFRYSHDLGVAVLVNDALTLWTLGYPDQALQRSYEACRLIENLTHPLTLAYAFAHLAIFHQYRREREEARQHAEVVTRVAREQGFPLWLGMGLILQGWARAPRLQPAEQLASMHEGMAIYRATESALFLPYFLTLLAETSGEVGQPDAGLRCLDEARAVMDSTQERFYEAEVHRVQGELVLAQAADQRAQAETCFQHALAIARRQQARSWELRAAMSLARLWQQQGKQAEARALLAPVYDWFTEGFGTADLQEARALLEALSDGHT